MLQGPKVRSWTPQLQLRSPPPIPSGPEGIPLVEELPTSIKASGIYQAAWLGERVPNDCSRDRGTSTCTHWGLKSPHHSLLTQRQKERVRVMSSHGAWACRGDCNAGGVRWHARFLGAGRGLEEDWQRPPHLWLLGPLRSRSAFRISCPKTLPPFLPSKLTARPGTTLDRRNRVGGQVA